MSCFKPLHSGAFLLTSLLLEAFNLPVGVSNPFIAGHSFLPLYFSRRSTYRLAFQTPS
jgi:hypothetical protein